MKIFKKIFSGRRESRVQSNWHDFLFPGDIMKPEAVAVFASPGVSGIWSAVYMAKALQESYHDKPLHFIVHSDYAAIAGFLPWPPNIHIYNGDAAVIEPEIQGDFLLFATEPSDELLRFVEKVSPRACISSRMHPSVNIHVRLEETAFPNEISGMMKVLGQTSFGDWKPQAPSVLADKASAILSPVSHRTLPYILATESAASILEKRRAEIPLKIVITDGKSSNIPPQTDHALLAAIVAGSSAVATTDRDLWIHGNALGIPVIGLDRKGTFTDWADEPSHGDSQFLEMWASLIRRGW